jgi:hypothetical protein
LAAQGRDPVPPKAACWIPLATLSGVLGFAEPQAAEPRHVPVPASELSSTSATAIENLRRELKTLQLQILHDGARAKLAKPWRERFKLPPKRPGAGARKPRDHDETGGRQGAGRVVPRAHVSPTAVNRLVNNPAADGNPLATQSEVSVAGAGPFLVAAWNDGGSSTGGMGYGWSADSGRTWVDGGDLPLGGSVARWVCDPVVTVNERTRAFYFAGMVITNEVRNGIGVIRGEFSGGALAWGTPVVTRSVRDTLPDKLWIAADSLTGALYLSYTTFFIIARDQSDQIEFQRSTDDNQTWSRPMILSSPRDQGLVQGSRPAIGPDGEVHVVWMAVDTTRSSRGKDHFRHRVSGDGGVNFSAEEDVAAVYPNFGSGAPGFDRGYGLMFPAIAVDRTHGPHRGRAYVTWNEGVNYFDDPPGVTGRAHEIEPNDFAAVASHIELGQTARGVIDNQDVDMFRFAGEQGQSVFIYVDSAGPDLYGSLRLLCADAQMRLAYSAPGWAGRPRVLVFTLPRTAEYHASISGFGGAEGGYRMRTGLLAKGDERARDHREVFVAWRDPGGSWREPVRANDDPPWFDNWFPEIVVAPDGRVYAAWYDWRDQADVNCGAWSHVYASRSDDGGASWTSLGAMSDEPSGWSDVGANLSPNQGDYIGMHAGDYGVAIAWGDGRYYNPDVFFRRIEPAGPLPPSSYPVATIERLVPNPAATAFRADFVLQGGAPARLEIADLAGRVVRRQTLEGYAPGRHGVSISAAGLPAGLYWVRVVEGGKSQAKKIALIP